MPRHPSHPPGRHRPARPQRAAPDGRRPAPRRPHPESHPPLTSPSYPEPTGTGPADLAIIGAGAAGLMAAATAAELGLRTILLEGRHRPGLKLLMCGNGRCNVTHDDSPAELCRRLGDPVGAFAKAAVDAFPPAALRQWLQDHGLKTIVRRGGRVFPARERAADVLQLFSDIVREARIPFCTQAPVTGLTSSPDGFTIQTTHFALPARRVLLCTGGVTYPKTGSVGDGQRLAAALGHTLTPYRPGLAGLEIRETWTAPFESVRFEDVRCQATIDGSPPIRLTGDLELARWGLGGGVISDLTRILSRRQQTAAGLRIDLCPRLAATRLAEMLRGGDGSASVRKLGRGPLADIPAAFFRALEAAASPGSRLTPQALAAEIKAVCFTPRAIRPLKEAMVTVGGVALDEIDPATMISRRCPGLSFAGEILDIDGPTGGYNLHLAFSTARLAVQSIEMSIEM